MSEYNGIEIYRSGMRNLEYLALGEQEAKLGILVATLAGLNVVLVGDPGGGKTTIGVDTYRLVDGINDTDVAVIPEQADLMPKQLVGGRAESVQTVEVLNGDEGNEKTETRTSVDISAIITPTTKWIFANEINRTAPFAVNGMLEAIEKGVINTTAGTQKIDKLQVAVATMNPGEATQGTFRMTRAFASRFAIGAVLGDAEKMTRDEQDDMITTLYGGWKPHPERIEPIVSIDDLPEIRAEIDNMPCAQSTVDSYVIPTIKKLHTVLGEQSLGEALPRMTIQLARISKTLAFLRGEQHGSHRGVGPKEITDAANFMVMARLGIMRSDVLTVAPMLTRAVTGY